MLFITRLFSFSQETIIRHLQRRYDELQIYTYVGDILIALNPFQNLSIYSPQVGHTDVLRGSGFLEQDAESIRCTVTSNRSATRLHQINKVD